jgi:ketosteroid isomerase-like protein
MNDSTSPEAVSEAVLAFIAATNSADDDAFVAVFTDDA